MKSIAHPSGRACVPHDMETRTNAVRRVVESGWTVKKACRYYHVSRPSLWRWIKRYDGTDASLLPMSHKPHSDHPAKKPPEYAEKVANLARRNPEASSIEIWVKALSEGFQICYRTCLRLMQRAGVHKPYETNPKRKHDGKYHTPPYPGDKWQLDVKYVPASCKSPKLEGKYFQYTVLDEASRKRHLYFSNELSGYEAVKALKSAFAAFGYKPSVVQTDNGFEFTTRAKAKREGESYFEVFLRSEGIRHHLIRPRTPEHNGKVERSHRIDQEKFYRYLTFHSLEDLREQGKRWNKRYNSTPRIVLNLKSPDRVEFDKLKALFENDGEIRCPKLYRCFTSSDN